MNKVTPIIWYDNILLDEELLEDSIEGVKEARQVEQRHYDRYFTSFFETNAADSIFNRVYVDIVRRGWV